MAKIRIVSININAAKAIANEIGRVNPFLSSVGKSRRNNPDDKTNQPIENDRSAILLVSPSVS